MSENWLAWRVSGPGIGQEFYYSLDKADLLLLVRAEIEKMQLQQFRSYIARMVQAPRTCAKKWMDSIFERFKWVYQNNSNFQEI